MQLWAPFVLIYFQCFIWGKSCALTGEAGGLVWEASHGWLGCEATRPLLITKQLLLPGSSASPAFRCALSRCAMASHWIAC